MIRVFCIFHLSIKCSTVRVVEAYKRHPFERAGLYRHGRDKKSSSKDITKKYKWFKIHQKVDKVQPCEEVGICNITIVVVKTRSLSILFEVFFSKQFHLCCHLPLGCI